jgi:hypothetical protein
MFDWIILKFDEKYKSWRCPLRSFSSFLLGILHMNKTLNDEEKQEEEDLTH